MKLTVCIPLYNGGHCVESALQSLDCQTRNPDEVIIRDDCSRLQPQRQLITVQITATLGYR